MRSALRTLRGALTGILVLSLLVVWTDGLAEVGVARRLRLASTSDDGAYSTGIVAIDLDLAVWGELRDLGEALVEDFPLPGGQRIDLELGPFQVVPPDAVFVTVNEDGERTRPRPDVRFFKGKVRGEMDSLVMLSLFQNRIAGFIRTGGEEFGVGPEEFGLSRPGAMELRVWNRATAEQPGGMVCDVPAPESVVEFGLADPLSAIPSSPQGAAQLVIEMAVDSTTEWCAHFGNDVSAAELYLVHLVASISAIYDSEVLLLVQVPYLRTFCGAADPYTNGLTQLADRSQLLEEMRAEWSTNLSGVDRTVAHLFSHSDDPGGFAGGLAHTVTCSGQNCQAVLCNPDYGYAVNLLPAQPGGPFTFEIKVAAHELGHNHSSPHTNCLQDWAGGWLSTCAVESCGLNPWCQATGCFPGPANTGMQGTIMATGCGSTVDPPAFENEAVEPILRGAAEAAACVAAAGLPAAVQEQTGDGLRVAPATACPGETLRHDDGSLESQVGGCQLAWVKRFTPSCYPYRLDEVQGIIRQLDVGHPVRLLVYTDPGGGGDPSAAELVYTEDVTVQTDSPSVFNRYVLASPVIVTSGDVYLGFFDLVDPSPYVAGRDNGSTGDSYWACGSASPQYLNPQSPGTWMIRGEGGAVDSGSLFLSWGAPCNATTTPGQDFAVYRGEIGAFTDYDDLTCSTNGEQGYLAQNPPDGSFFLVVTHTSAAEGSYGTTGAGEERPASTLCGKPQDFEECP